MVKIKPNQTLILIEGRLVLTVLFLLKHSMAAAIVPAAKTTRPELGSPLEPHASRPRDVAAHGAESLGANWV